MFNKKPFLYRFRMYLFGQKYSAKERFIMSLAVILYGIGTGWAIPFIINDIMGLPLDSKVKSFFEFLQVLLYFMIYLAVSYIIFYYICKFIVESILYIFSFIKAKLR